MNNRNRSFKIISLYLAAISLHAFRIHHHSWNDLWDIIFINNRCSRNALSLISKINSLASIILKLWINGNNIFATCYKALFLLNCWTFYWCDSNNTSIVANLLMASSRDSDELCNIHQDCIRPQKIYRIHKKTFVMKSSGWIKITDKESNDAFISTQ